MPKSEHGEFEDAKKSAYSIEYYDSSWEFEYMKELEADMKVTKWTKNHGLQIKYFDDEGKFRTFKPDFLVEMIDGTKELHEMKGTHLLDNPITRRKVDKAREWCKNRGMNFRIISKYQ